MNATLDNPQVRTTAYNGEPFEAVRPQADNDELAARGPRVVYYASRWGAGMHKAELQIAPAGLLCAGWVIGVIESISPAPVERGDKGTQGSESSSHIGSSRRIAGGSSFCRAIDIQPASNVHSWEGGDR